MMLPTIPLNTPLLVVIVLNSAIPGLCFPPGAPGRQRRGRLVAGLILGSLAGWLLGSSALASELPVPTTVLALLAATVLFAEGVAGRGWPLAGTLSVTVFLAAVVLDLLDRTGEKMSWIVWPIAIGISLVVASITQAFWRVLWKLRSRQAREGTSPASENDNSR